MSKSSNQKLKLIYLMKILLEWTDETHSITMPESIEALAAYDISAECKSLYNDNENLRVYGLDVIGTQEDRTYSYHIGNRQFELAKLKLLVDSVQSAKFITAKKSNELIKKIEGLASKYEASQLHRQAFKSFDMAAYARKMFGMYGGKEEWVCIECDNSFAGVMIDRFGKDVSMIRLDDKRFVVNVEVAVSRQFLAWIIGLGEGVTLAGPDSVVEMMNAEIDRLIKQYK